MYDNSKAWEVTKEEIEKRISPTEILQYYLPGKGVKYSLSCPMHKDKTPSLWVDLNLNLFHCFSCKRGGDCYKYVMERYSVDYYSALRIIANDFGLLHEQCDKRSLEYLGLVLPKPKKKEETDIKIKVRDWEKRDEIYWNQYGISIELCNFFKVFPISHYWVNGYLFTIKASELVYAYYERGKFKIYFPNAKENEVRFWSNDGGCVYGIDQLPEFGDELFITSSKKDIMTLRALGHFSVSANAESSYIEESVLNDLKRRFKRIIIWLNNDQQGLKSGHYLSIKYDLPFVYIPLEIDEKDPSDYLKVWGKDKTKELIQNIIL